MWHPCVPWTTRYGGSWFSAISSPRAPDGASRPFPGTRPGAARPSRGCAAVTPSRRGGRSAPCGFSPRTGRNRWRGRPISRAPRCSTNPRYRSPLSMPAGMRLRWGAERLCQVRWLADRAFRLERSMSSPSGRSSAAWPAQTTRAAVQRLRHAFDHERGIAASTCPASSMKRPGTTTPAPRCRRPGGRARPPSRWSGRPAPRPPSGCCALSTPCCPDRPAPARTRGRS